MKCNNKDDFHFRLDIHRLSDTGGDDPEFPELGLGYSKISEF